tara:strand:+ start:754 stop:2760 length:2007 start_codon:yes stop_codon:yes gene_type:complete
MDEEQILLELQKRNVDVNFLMSSSDNILQELKARGLEETQDGNFLPTVDQQRKDQGAYGRIVDDMEIPEANSRSQAVEDYLTSPEFGRLALEISGAVAGAAFPPLAVARAAMLVRPALRLAATKMGGAAVGGAGGAAVSQTFDPTFNPEDNFGEVMASISKDMLKSGAIAATGEGAGLLIGKGITKVLGKNKKLLDGAEDAVKTIEEQKTKILANPKSYSQEVKDAVKVGQLTPALLQKGQTIDILENVSESSLFGGGALRYAKEGANTVAQSGLDDFLKLYKVKAGDGALGQLFQKTLTKDLQAFKSIANTKYKAVDDALNTNNFANNFQVDLTNLKTFAAEELKNLGLKGQSSNLKSFLTDILNEPNYTTFKRANILRGDFLEQSRAFTTETLGKKKGRLSAIASQEITDAMDNSVVPNSVKSLLKDANKHYREGAEVFNDTLFKKIIDNDPDLVYKSIIAAGDRPTLVKKTFEILNKRIKDVGERNILKNKIRGEFLDDLMSKSQRSNDQFGVELDAEKLFKNFAKKEDTFKAIFSNTEINNFKKFQNALKFAQGRKSKTGGLPGGMMIQMKQSGALIQLASAASAYGTGMTGVSAGILIAPAIIAKAFTSPKIIKALTLGIKYQDNPSLSRRYFLQSMTYMAKDGLISEDDLENIKNDVEDSKK